METTNSTMVETRVNNERRSLGSRLRRLVNRIRRPIHSPAYYELLEMKKRLNES
ncbi:MAG: hypothetical protein M1504_01955 [Candidatus Marsarchaeota archaeon]|nr:hypothetical protein [Candidatus Marsarchaeota archaeon]